MLPRSSDDLGELDAVLAPPGVLVEGRVGVRVRVRVSVLVVVRVRVWVS